jgi:uncharacterized membrane protein
MTPNVTRSPRSSEQRFRQETDMANLHVLSGAAGESAQPIVRKISFADLRDAIAKGYDDFLAMPTQVIPLCVIYPVVGLVVARLSFGYDMMPILFPLAAGFALIGPFRGHRSL